LSKSIEFMGKTIEEAISSALKELGVEQDAVSIEVLEKQKSGFLGIGSSPAKIRATLIVNETPEASPEKRAKPAATVQTTPKPPIAKPDRAGISARPIASFPKIRSDIGCRGSWNQESEPPSPEFTEKAVSLLNGILGRMNLSDPPPRVEAIQNDQHLLLEVFGENMGRMIGRRGDTLDALQRLVSGILNRDKEKHTRVVIDTEQYREKRDTALISLAHRTAANAVRYKSNQILDPMNAYARHVIHATLQDNPEVTTHSVGNEPLRRIVVAVPGGARKYRQ